MRGEYGVLFSCWRRAGWRGRRCDKMGARWERVWSGLGAGMVGVLIDSELVIVNFG